MSIFKQHTTYKIYYFLFLALVIALPIHGRLVPPIISLIGINWILELNFRQKYRMIITSSRLKYLLSFGVLYVLYVIGTLYSKQLYSQEGALFNLEVKLSLVVFPIFFTTIDFERIEQNFKRKLQYAFIIGCFISLILIFNNAVYSYFQLNSTDVFYYANLAFVHHPSYLALYFTFAIAILLNWIFQYRGGNTFKRNMAFILILVFQLFIVLLSSKAGILALAMTYILVIFFYLVYRGHRINILISGTLLIVFLLTLSFFPQSYSRFYNAESALENEPDPDSVESSVARILIWQTSLELIKNNPLFGVGTGDVKTELMKLYEEKNIKLAMDETLNAHNQYLQTFIALGIIGFVALIACFVLPAVYAFRKKHLLYLLFLAIFAFNLLVESMIERQAGVVFYALFNSFLFYYTYSENPPSDPELP